MTATAASDRAHHRRRFSGRDPSEAHRAATPLELLFDLTFVVAFGTAGERARPLSRGRAVQAGDLRLRLRDLRGLVGVDQLLLVRVGLRHRRLGVPPRDDGADGRRDRPRARPPAGVRVDRPRRGAGQRRHGRRLRRHARADGVPVGAGGARRPAPAPGGVRVHLDDLGRAGVLGRARDHRLADRGDVRDRAGAARDRDVGPVHRGALQAAARPGTRVTSPSATACS